MSQEAATWFAGVDWGSELHQVCMMEPTGKVVGERGFAHGGAGLAALADWLVSFAGEAAAVAGAIETPRGPVVESLMERGFVVHAINPKQLDRFRDRLSPAGAKDDRRDARVLADALRTDPHCLRRLTATTAKQIEMREWSRIAEDLKRELMRLANRMREQLWRYYPQFLDAVGKEEVASRFALALWQRLPNPKMAANCHTNTLAKLLQQYRVRRLDAAGLHARLREPTAPLAPGSAKAAEAHVRLVVKRLGVVTEQLAEAQAQLGELVKSPPTDAPESEADTTTSDATVLLSVPGVGTTVVATLLAEAPDAVQRRDYHALRCLCGTAPVTRRSGKSLIVVRRLAAHHRLRDAVYHWARVAAQRDPHSKEKYQALRARGHGHARALRSVADRLLNVACAMLRAGTVFDPQYRGAQA